jgi:hypothetical protein
MTLLAFIVSMIGSVLPSFAYACTGDGNCYLADNGVFSSVPTALQMINVRSYGALGNSTGVHGNGSDDTTAFQSALNAVVTQMPAAGQTGGTMYVPCGTYRITSGISSTATYPATLHIKGDGICSQIYADAASGFTVFTFAPTGGCTSAAPCLILEGLNFIPPNTAASSVALSSTGNGAPVFRNNIVNGYTTGVKLTTSYAPIINSNFFTNLLGYAVDCTVDSSCNNANFISNRVYNSGATYSAGAFGIGANSGSNCTSSVQNVLLLGNDIEGGYGGPVFFGACSVTLEGNYIERNSNFPFWISASAKNAGFRITGNWFYHNGASDTFSIQNVVGVTFGHNTWYNQSLTYGAGVSAVTWEYQRLEGTSALASYCSESVNCTYLPNGNLYQWGYGNTSSATPGVLSVTYPIACPNAFLSANVSSYNGSSIVKSSIGTTSTTGMTLYSDAGPATVAWSVICR